MRPPGRGEPDAMVVTGLVQKGKRGEKKKGEKKGMYFRGAGLLPKKKRKIRTSEREKRGGKKKKTRNEAQCTPAEKGSRRRGGRERK